MLRATALVHSLLMQAVLAHVKHMPDHLEIVEMDSGEVEVWGEGKDLRVV